MPIIKVKVNNSEEVSVNVRAFIKGEAVVNEEVIFLGDDGYHLPSTAPLGKRIVFVNDVSNDYVKFIMHPNLGGPPNPVGPLHIINPFTPAFTIYQCLWVGTRWVVG